MLTLYLCLWTVAILALLPLGLYLIGVLKDPLHPTIFVGGLTFFIVCYRPIFINLDQAFRFIDVDSLQYYLIVAGASLLAFYIGVGLHKRRYGDQVATKQDFPVEFSVARLATIGTLYACIGVPIALLTLTDYTRTGYIRDLAMLWVPAFILLLQVRILRGALRNIPAWLMLAFAAVPPMARIIVYGQRGDTFRMAVVIIPVFLLLGKRPSRAFFIPAILALGLVMGTLDRTRGMVEAGYASNRFDAILKVIPSFWEDWARPDVRYGGTEEFIFGSAMIQAVRDTGAYNCGRFLADTAIRFYPKEFLGDKDQFYSPWSRTRVASTTGDLAGYRLPFGAMPSGFAHTFVEFWWFSLLFWAGLGYWVRRQYLAAVRTARLDFHAYFTVLFIILLYLIAQDMYDFVMNMIYMFASLWAAYHFARVPATAEDRLQVAPAPETAIPS